MSMQLKGNVESSQFDLIGGDCGFLEKDGSTVRVGRACLLSRTRCSL